MIRMRTTGICGLPGAMVAAALILTSAAATVYAQEPTMLEETADHPYALAATLHVDDPDALQMRLVMDYTDEANTYVITCTPHECYVERAVEGDFQRIGTSRPYGEFQADTDLELTVRRDGWRIELILGRKVLARAWDRELPVGKVGYMVSGGEITEPMLQPLGEIYMTDDFMRTADTKSVWEPIGGTWKTQSLRVDEQSERMEADKSANAFSYWGKAGDAPGIAATGYWFWNDYEITAAVRPEGADPLGLVAYFQDPENYLLARWTSALSEAEDGDRLQLIAMVDGERTVLAEAGGGHIPDQWYSLRLRVGGGLIQCLVDDEPKLVAGADLFGQGQPGLYCEGDEGTFFDSVAVEDWTVLSDDFDVPAPGKWVARRGEWQTQSGAIRAEGSGLRLATTGREQWQRYWCAADVAGNGAGGIAVCVGESSWYGVRFGPQGSGVDYEGQAQIVRVTDGSVEVLASAPAHLPGGNSHRVRAIVDEGLITGYLDGSRVLDAFDAGARSGAVGLIADGNGPVQFDNVYVTMLPPRRIARVTKEFTEGDEHPEMAEWASTRAPWLKPQEDGGTWWTKGDYFGDKTIAFEIPGVKAAEGKVTLWLEAAPAEPSSAVQLVLSTDKGSGAISATLKAGEETLGEKQVETSGDPCPVRFERKGTWVVVSIDGNVIFSEKR